MRWKAATAGLALVALAAGFWAYAERQSRIALATRLENERQRAFVELLSHVENVGALLSKSLVSASPRHNAALFAQLGRHAAAAHSSLTRLPLVGLPTERAARFLNQVGDFSASMGRQVARGAPVNDEQWQTLDRLHAQTRQLAVHLRELQRQMRAEGLRFNPSQAAVAVALGREQAGPPTLLAERLTNLDREVQQFPGLIYDGPFSDHLLRPEPLGLRPGEVSPDEARRIALRFAPLPPGMSYDAVVTGERDGPIPVYAVAVTPAAAAGARDAAGGDAGPTFHVDVTRRGGQVSFMLNPRAPAAGRDGVTAEQARDRAAAFLRERDYPQMQPTYSMSEDGTAVVTFAAVQDGVRLYPDLVKVRVARDTGEVTGLEAVGFLMSHRRRDLPRPALTAAEARDRVHHRADVIAERLALIPLDTRTEVLTYEFHVRLGQDEFLVYVNALTGEEEKILQLIHGPEGTLTM